MHEGGRGSSRATARKGEASARAREGARRPEREWRASAGDKRCARHVSRTSSSRAFCLISALCCLDFVRGCCAGLPRSASSPPPCGEGPPRGKPSSHPSPFARATLIVHASFVHCVAANLTLSPTCFSGATAPGFPAADVRYGITTTVPRRPS